MGRESLKQWVVENLGPLGFTDDHGHPLELSENVITLIESLLNKQNKHAYELGKSIAITINDSQVIIKRTEKEGKDAESLKASLAKLVRDSDRMYEYSDYEPSIIMAIQRAAYEEGLEDGEYLESMNWDLDRAIGSRALRLEEKIKSLKEETDNKYLTTKNK